MSELKLRAPTREDAPAIAELLNAHSGALFGERELAPAQILDWFGLPDIWMRLAEVDGRSVGYADVSEEGGRFSIDLRALDPEAASILLGAAREHAGAGAVLRGYAPSVDEIAAGAYRDAEFAIVRHSFQMRVELAAPPDPPVLSKGIAVRPMRDGEEERIHAAHMSAFADHWEFHEQSFEQWRRWHRDRDSFDATLWFLALAKDETEDEIAGFVLCAPHFSGEPDFGWIELLGVRPAWRRRGLGEALLRHGLRALRARGFKGVGLGVDAENTTGAVRLYERVGMRPVRRSDTWELRT
ncbi:MAG: GNAT family N-acetyltransferase [Gaiellaceae bacterium]